MNPEKRKRIENGDWDISGQNWPKYDDGDRENPYESGEEAIKVDSINSPGLHRARRLV